MNRRFLTLSFSAVVAVAATALAHQLVIQRIGPVTLHNHWRVYPAGESVRVNDLVAGGVLSPDRRWLAFVSAGQGNHELHIVDAQTGKIASTTRTSNIWAGLAWSPQSDRVFISGGTLNRLATFAIDREGKAIAGAGISIPSLGVATQNARPKAYLAGLALNPAGDKAWLANTATDEIKVIDIPGRSEGPSIKLEAEDSPFALTWDSQAGSIWATLQGAGALAEIDPVTGAVKRRVSTGAHPNSILISGERVFVACGNSDEVWIHNRATGEVMEKLACRPWRDAPPGSTPNALALSPDGKTLLVALADNNCLLMADVTTPNRSEVKGFIPTGAYPTSVAFSADGKKVVVGSGYGFGTGPNGFAPDGIDPVAPKGYPYIVTLRHGLISRLDVPNELQLAAYTQEVRTMAGYKPGIAARNPQAPAPGASAIPSRQGDPSPIKHVIYIIKENRTYDQLFGDLTDEQGKKIGNGDPRLVLFGEDVTPNHRQLAREYVLLDNLMCNGDVSVDGHSWSNAAYVPDFMQRTWPQQYSAKGAPRLTKGLSATPSGRLWEVADRAGKSVRTYYYHTTFNANEEWGAARRANRRDFDYVDIFIKDFQQFDREGKVPNLMVLALSEDHTNGLRAGSFTPKAMVASNDLAIGKLVEAVSKSKAWGQTAIFIIQDDAQNGPDHVDAHRTVALAVSPFTRRRGVDSSPYDTCSFLRSIELILGLPPMSQFDAAALPLFKAFGSKPDLTPYTARTPKQDLMVKNPERIGSLTAEIDFSEPDQLTVAQEDALNRELWTHSRGSEPYPGITRRIQR